MSFLKKWEPFTLLLLRCGLGSVFIYHGCPSEARNVVESLQAIGLPGYFVFVTGVVEFFGGLTIAPGFFMPVGFVGESFPHLFIS